MNKYKILIFTLLFVFINSDCKADDSLPKILISEVKIAGESSSYDEFIELYNPNSFSVNLDGWSLKRLTGTGGDGGYISSNLGVKKYPEERQDKKLQIPAFGYLLVVPRDNCGENKNEKCYLGGIQSGNYYSTNSYLADNNSLILYDENKSAIDIIGWGIIGGESQGVENIEKGKSLERKIVDGLIVSSFLDNPSPQNSAIEIVEESADVKNEEDLQDDNFVSDNNTQSYDSSNNTSNAISDKQNNLYENETKIVINEFLIDPEDSDKDNEFIEIYNTGKNEVDVSGWILEDQFGSIKQYKIPSTTKIKAEEYLVFYSDETGITLNNSGDGIILKNSFGKIISKTPVSGAAQEEISYSLGEKGSWFWTKAVTAGLKNVIQEIDNNKDNILDVEKQGDEEEKVQDNLDFSDGVMISEILPDPFGKDNQEGAYEWIEIFNESEVDVNLKGWILDDVLNKGSKPYQIKEDLIIASHKYLIISSDRSKLFLNNPGDEVNLLWPDNTICDSVEYKKSKEGYSYILSLSGEWGWSDKPSPGEKNIDIISSETDLNSSVSVKNSKDFSENESDEIDNVDNGEVLSEVYVDREQYQYIDIASAKKLSPHSLVGIDGIVSTPPGVFADNLFYIYDQKTGEGVQIYGYQKDFSDILLGDYVQVFGFISEVGQEKRIVVDKNFIVEKISSDNLISFNFFLTGKIGVEKSGNLAEIKGEVVEVLDNGVLYVDDSTGKVKVYIKPTTGISENFNKGDQVLIKGQISSTSLGVRVLPRFSGDIVFLEKSVGVIIKKNEDSQFLSVFSGIDWQKIFMFLILIVFVDWMRVRFVYNRKRYENRY